MFRRDSFVFHILIFIAAQIAWLGILGLWIYWYVSNYIIYEKVGEQLSPQLDVYSPNVWIFIGGIILIVGAAFILSILFRNYSLQLKLARLYDNFIGNVTHELKSPLASIQLYLETLKSRNVPEEKQKEFLDYMMKDAGRLNNLINSILDISVLEQKRISHNFNVFNSESVIKKIIAEIAEQVRIPVDSIKIEGTPECEIVVDENALKIVFDNLIDNAIKYSVDGLNIHINLKNQSGKFIIEFSDSGIGIPASELKKIFKKFYRIYSSNIPSVKGTGLGLYWVKEIIKHHGGKISAYSMGENKGATFRIELPIYKVSKRRWLNKLLKFSKKN
ncbi:two-component sensor histidine kinase [hydrocarbon metagenome]|uniref:histidine kinase n=1 Tax=hydrocarbon metagenome TaxID=938273 RepID=A0A0W8G1N5_9ZZZZ